MPSVHLVFRRAALAFAAALSYGAAAAQSLSAPPAPATPQAASPSLAASTPTPVPLGRPRIGLVLSGGGARGLAHVGVLKVLERARVPIDLIAGTSMGAIIGGLYASGMSASELESELLQVNWETVFASRVDRQLLSQRRKDEDFEIATAVELGMRNGELRAPLGALSGRGLETLLRRYTLPVRSVRHFDQLPIPFRAVATDMETGQPVVLAQGDLALALRSSMSVPGVFAPTEIDDRILGDGGLVNNVPVDVIRAMGADVVIVVNIGTPLSGREALSSVGGLTGQMINILTEQNVQRSLAKLTPADVLITPSLGPLSAGDFDKVRDFIGLGELGTQPVGGRLEGLALDPSAYSQWQMAHRRAATAPTTLAFVRFQGTEISNPERFVAQLESKPGQPFDPAAAERDARRLAASGDYTRADYLLASTPEGDGLVFDVEDKPWGPHYFRLGLDLSTDFRGGGGFNLKISHNRHWLDANGTEWRNRVQIGQNPRWFTELYHPLNWTVGISNDWFVAGYADILRRDLINYDNTDGSERARIGRATGRLGIDFGQPWAELGEVRIGLTQVVERFDPEIVSGNLVTLLRAVSVRETGLRLGAVVDQLDYANFPQRGYRVVAEVLTGYRRNSVNDLRERFTRFESEGTLVRSWGAHTLNGHVRLQGTGGEASGLFGRYTLGGFHQLSGYASERFDGDHVAFGRLTWYRRSAQAPVFTRGAFVGATLEAGNAWARASQVSLRDLRTGMSVFVGADTGLGPLYFGVTHAPRGSTGLYLFIGRP